MIFIRCSYLVSPETISSSLKWVYFYTWWVATKFLVLLYHNVRQSNIFGKTGVFMCEILILNKDCYQEIK